VNKRNYQASCRAIFKKNEEKIAGKNEKGEEGAESGLRTGWKDVNSFSEALRVNRVLN
jgi:hypothetical protein